MNERWNSELLATGCVQLKAGSSLFIKGASWTRKMLWDSGYIFASRGTIWYFQLRFSVRTRLKILQLKEAKCYSGRGVDFGVKQAWVWNFSSARTLPILFHVSPQMRLPSCFSLHSSMFLIQSKIKLISNAYWHYNGIWTVRCDIQKTCMCRHANQKGNVKSAYISSNPTIFTFQLSLLFFWQLPPWGSDSFSIPSWFHRTLPQTGLKASKRWMSLPCT